jgi:aspartyl-tRNA(Asn)/glutamyl-tRNA(Gln) amidotransferase subunit B
MGHPGTLPVVNMEAVKHVLRMGIAVEGTLADFTEFDRKNYFYPDIPKGYQISQYAYPLVRGGELGGVQLTRIHLEEDTARSQHDQGDGSLIDYNRAGVPLMELVTEPVIHDAKTASQFAKELQLLLRTIGISDANMERGEMRVEANISVSKTDTFGTKVEVKNLNSFKSVEAAISYEIKRQVDLIEAGESIVQETRGWDESKNKTYSQRKKESADDYRYFPEPDIPKLRLSLDSSLSLSRLSDLLPELPSEKREKYRNLGISSEQIESIIGSPLISHFFHQLVDSVTDSDVLKLGANYLTTDVVPLLSSDRVLMLDSVGRFTELLSLVKRNALNSRVAKDLLPLVLFESIDPEQYAREHNLMQNSSPEALRDVVREVIREHTSVVAEYKAGKLSSIQYLIGQGMKLSRGSANPATLKQLFEEELV